jgi:hypothetical protein
MSTGHFHNAGGYIDHDEVEPLFPVESLPGVVQQRDAQLRLQSVAPKAVLAVRPTGLASSYFLTQHPLTAIDIDALPSSTRRQIAQICPGGLDQFEVIQVGRGVSAPDNHSLREWTA